MKMCDRERGIKMKKSRSVRGKVSRGRQLGLSTHQRLAEVRASIDKNSRKV